MIYSCKECDFNAFSEKALANHMKEKHTKPVVIPIPKPPEQVKPPEQKPEFKGFNFMMEFKNCKVICKLISGEVITGTFDRFSPYEISIWNDNSEIIVMKHAIATLQKEHAPAASNAHELK